jgi:ABC-type multidrug transport system fused ATPase/permease subunit
MELTIELFGNLIITFMSFVVPIFGALLSIFHKGIEKLQNQYKSETNQAEENIRNQLEEISKNKEDIKEKEIRDNLAKIRKIKSSAKRKLSLLEPKQQVVKLFTSLLFCLLLIEVIPFMEKKTLNILSLSFLWEHVLLASSVLIFFWILRHMVSLIDILVEIKKAESIDNYESEIKQLLLSIAKKEDEFLKKVYISINKEKIVEDGTIIKAQAQEKNEWETSLVNNERRMAKNIQIGIMFPPEFIIEKNSSYSITNDEASQIVRYSVDILHGNTNKILDPLTVTGLTKGKYEITTFIKAENIESTYRKLTLKVE